MNSKRKIEVKKSLKMKKCRYCLSTENLTIDHKIPLSKGGKDVLSNLQCLCKRCNGIKSSLSHREVQRFFAWFKQIEKARMGGKEFFTGRVKL